LGIQAFSPGEEKRESEKEKEKEKNRVESSRKKFKGLGLLV